MPLVFVHGVNTRRGETAEEQGVFDDQVTLLQQHFAKVAFSERVSKPHTLQTFVPYWGDLGVKFARNFASIPKAGVQSLAVTHPARVDLYVSTASRLDADMVRQPGIDKDPLLTVAKARSLSAAVDLLFAGATNAPKSGATAPKLKAALPEAARFSGAAEAYAQANPKPAWLSTVQNDQAFVQALFDEVNKTGQAADAGGGGDQSLGIGSDVLNWLKAGATAVKGAVSEVTMGVKNAVAGAAKDVTRTAFVELSEYVRPTASAFAGRFFGDIFTYMDNRQPIIDRVLKSIRDADAARKPGDNELYLVGHSFGGIILYDVLTQFAPNLRCDLFVTVGSQVAAFAEMGRLAAANDITEAFKNGGLVPRPAAAARWLNIYDLTDFVGFGTKGVFEGVIDYEFKTDALPLVSHAAYFDTPRFFARLRERLKEAFEKGTG